MWVMLVVAWVFFLPALSLGTISPVTASMALVPSVTLNSAAATPPAIIATLNKVTLTALADPAVKEKLAGQGLTTAGGTPEQFRAFIASEFPRYTEYEWAPNGDWLDLSCDPAKKDFAWNSGMESVASVDEAAKVWRVEVRILADLGHDHLTRLAVALARIEAQLPSRGFPAASSAIADPNSANNADTEATAISAGTISAPASRSEKIRSRVRRGVAAGELPSLELIDQQIPIATLHMPQVGSQKRMYVRLADLRHCVRMSSCAEPLRGNWEDVWCRDGHVPTLARINLPNLGFGAKRPFWVCDPSPRRARALAALPAPHRVRSNEQRKPFHRGEA